MLFSATASTAAGAPVEQVTLTLDGVSLPLSYDADTMAVSATLETPGDGEHRLTLTALDANGNWHATPWYKAANSKDTVFADTEGHWAQDRHCLRLCAQPLLGRDRGRRTDLLPPRPQPVACRNCRSSGASAGRERSKITRKSSLPFEGCRLALPEWGAPLYQGGLCGWGLSTAAPTETGAVYAAGEPITPRRACDHPGKDAAKGYAAGELTFSDADTIPDWGRRGRVGTDQPGDSGGLRGRQLPAERRHQAK